ncbi:Isochorismatase [Serratia fonticola]|uniref:Isochorismatase n=1 Tax=Serratia fonticola TaxID=47917 RepID=A0A4U9WKB0_SERFO|nr:Isochorismatase [Serratia fonticola]
MICGGRGLNKHPEQQAVVSELAPDADDTVLVKWRYSAFHRSPLQEILQESGRDQLIICGVYAHIGCMTTAIDAFMRNIKPFMVADGLADFSREEHLMALRYTAGRCGSGGDYRRSAPWYCQHRCVAPAKLSRCLMKIAKTSAMMKT